MDGQKPDGLTASWSDELFREAPHAIAIVDVADGTLLDVNNAFLLLHGYQRDEVIGRTTIEMGFWRDASQREQFAAILRRDGLVRDFAVSSARKSGEIRSMSLTVKPFTINGKTLHAAFVRDITEELATKQALVQSEAEARSSAERAATESAQLQAVLGSIREGVYVTDAQGQILCCNAAFRKMNECSNPNPRCIGVPFKCNAVDEHPVHQLLDLDGNVIPAVRDPVQILLRGGEVPPCRYWFQTHTGRRLIVSFNGTAIRDEHGTITMAVLTLSDVTAIARAEAATRESERMYRLLAENVGDVIWTYDLQQERFTYVSPSIEKLRGYPPEEAMTHTYEQALTPESLAVVRELLPARVAAFMGGDPAAVTQVNELEQFHRDGTRVWTEVVTTFLPGKRPGEMPTVLGVSRDISKRKEIEGKLVDSERRFRAVFERATDGMALIDPRGYCFHVANSQLCRMLQLEAAQITGLSAAQLLPASTGARIASSLEKLAIADAASELDIPLQRADGSTIYIDFHSFPLPLAERGWIVAILRDATERHRAAEQAKHYERRLRQLAMEASVAEERERRKLSAHLHDHVCQLLSLAQIRLSLARGDHGHASGSFADTEQLIQRANAASRSLMLQLSHPALYDLGFVAGAEWLAEDIERLYGMHVTLHDQGTPPEIELKMRVVLFQCLRELLVNAAKYAGVDKVEVTIAHSGGKLRLTVKDAGLGFDPRAIECAGRSRGFGLFSIRERLRSLGGEMLVQSASGQGTTVSLEVDLAASSSMEQEA